MALIFDFDGTFTPYSNPPYPIFDKCGIHAEEFFKKVFAREDIYQSFCDNYKDILHANNLKVNSKNVSFGAENTILNKGVISFLDYFKEKKAHLFIVSSSLEEYIKKTSVAPFCTEIIGTAIDEHEDVSRLVTDTKKVDIINNLIEKYNLKPEEIIYFGDGLTDKHAFKFVKELGGKAILVYDENKEKDKKKFQVLNELNVIDKAFSKDFSLNSPLFHFVDSLMM